MNTQVSLIARRQARMAGFAPSLKASADKGNDTDDDEDDAISSSDDEMTTS